MPNSGLISSPVDPNGVTISFLVANFDKAISNEVPATFIPLINNKFKSLIKITKNYKKI